MKSEKKKCDCGCGQKINPEISLYLGLSESKGLQKAILYFSSEECRRKIIQKILGGKNDLSD